MQLPKERIRKIIVLEDTEHYLNFLNVRSVPDQIFITLIILNSRCRKRTLGCKFCQ